MHKFLFYIFLFGFYISQSQTIIRVYVKDSLANPINSSSVIIKSKNKILGYGYKDKNGFFEQRVKYFDDYYIKVLSLGYESYIKKVKPTKNKIELNIVLKNKSVNLKTITINSDIPEVIQKKDTIIFNLKKLVRGDEMTLKDLIRKMPGLKIKNDGSITINGKNITKILVEDRDFFNNQVQLTYNTIPAKIVKGLEVYKNYKDILTNKSIKPERVLNVKIKDKYKNKIIGSVSVLGAYSKKYDINLNLFKFQKNITLTYIGNYNNIARPTMSLKDYLNFINDNNFDNDDNILDTRQTIPVFLLPNQNKKSLILGFSAINFSYKKQKKISLNSFLLFNNSQQIISLISKKFLMTITLSKISKMI